MKPKVYDAIIIGGGHNGLVCAAYLGKAGFSVKVLEKRSVVGGAATTEEFFPGFRNSICSYTVGLLSSQVVNDLNLFDLGLRLVARPMSNFLPTADGGYLKAYADRERFACEIEKHSKDDARALASYDHALKRIGASVRTLLHNAPPNIGGGVSEIWRALRVGRQFSRLDAEVQNDLFDIFTLSSSRFLSRWFKSDAMKALLAFDSAVGTLSSPYDPGTAYVLLHHCLGDIMPNGAWGHAIGGMGAISKAIEKAALQHSVMIETNSPVKTLLIDDNKKAIGVEIERGKAVYGKAIIANINPKLLFQSLVKPEAVPQLFLERMQRYNCASGSFRMNVALSELPNFLCLPNDKVDDHHGAGIILAPTLNYQHQALEDANRFGWSKRPIVEMLIPSTLDNSLAPKGQHVASLFCQHFVPDLPNGQKWDTCRSSAANSIIELVTEFAPNFKKSIIAQQILSPLDLEREFGLVGGDIFHGSLTINQIWSARPQIGYANYRMPIKNLYLCGAGAHPGGGVTGIPGYNAARAVLEDFHWWRRKFFSKTINGNPLES